MRRDAYQHRDRFGRFAPTGIPSTDPTRVNTARADAARFAESNKTIIWIGLDEQGHMIDGPFYDPDKAFAESRGEVVGVDQDGYVVTR